MVQINSEQQNTFTLEEVAKCNGKDDPRTWIIYKDSVYDVTSYLDQDEHPGGNELIEEVAGKDATKGFDDYGHSNDAKNLLREYKIGEVVPEQRKANLKKLNKSKSPQKTKESKKGDKSIKHNKENHGCAKFSLDEVARHDGKQDPNTWIIYKDSVYDVTEYLAKDEHPGSNELIEEFAGKDLTKGFDDYGHSSDAKNLLKSFKIGEIIEEQKKAKLKKIKTKSSKPGNKLKNVIKKVNLTKENEQCNIFTVEEVAKHNGSDDPNTWIIYRGSVYDVTEFIVLDEHPGGSDLIQEYAGKDATKGFDDYGHSNDAKKLLKTYKIGELTQNPESSLKEHEEESNKSKLPKKQNDATTVIKENNETNIPETYTLEEIAKHNGKDISTIWIVYKDSVYDISDFLENNEHPGGNELIEEYAGKDATKAFDDFGHSRDAFKMLKFYNIGTVVEEQRRKNLKKHGKDSLKNSLEINGRQKNKSKGALYAITCGLIKG